MLYKSQVQPKNQVRCAEMLCFWHINLWCGNMDAKSNNTKESRGGWNMVLPQDSESLDKSYYQHRGPKPYGGTNRNNKFCQTKTSYFGHIMRSDKYRTLHWRKNRLEKETRQNKEFMAEILATMYELNCSELQWIQLDELTWSPTSWGDKAYVRAVLNFGTYLRSIDEEKKPFERKRNLSSDVRNMGICIIWLVFYMKIENLFIIHYHY